MVIYVKNKALHKRVMQSSNRFANLAIKAYTRNDMKKGKVYENRSDTVYAKNYKKMYGFK